MTMTAQKTREFALSLPDVSERETWGHPTFRLGEHIVASLPEDGVVMVKTDPAEQQALIRSDPDTYAAAPRLGDHGWLHVQLARVPAEDLRSLITRAWADLAPRSLLDRHPDLAP